MSDNESDDGTPPNATVYVQNLDEKTKIPDLIDTLRALFEDYGTIIDIVAKKNMKAKGQAFIVYETPEQAQTAIDEMIGFDLGGRTMRVSFAKTRSDATVKKDSGDQELEKHKEIRIAERKRKQATEAEEARASKRAAEETLAERPAKNAKPAQTAGVVPNEYLPPNKILFLQDLDESYGKTQLTAVFGRYPGFKEVRTVPGRPGIAFAEYESDETAVVAKEALDGKTLGEKVIKVTYQRK